MQWMGGGVNFPGTKSCEGVLFNLISATRGWVGVKFPGKKRYGTLEWHLRHPPKNTEMCALIERSLASSNLFS